MCNIFFSEYAANNFLLYNVQASMSFVRPQTINRFRHPSDETKSRLGQTIERDDQSGSTGETHSGRRVTDMTVDVPQNAYKAEWNE